MTPVLDLAIRAARLFQYAAASLMFGIPLFQALGLDVGRDRRGAARTRPVLAGASILSMTSSIAWSMAQTADMTDDPASAWDAGAVWDMLSSTHVGRMALLRIGLAAGALLLTIVPLASRRRMFLQVATGAALLGSLAWSGHGDTTPGWAGGVHVAADVVHLWAAAAWITAIGAFCVTAGRVLSCPSQTDRADFCLALERFSGIGSVTVAAIVLTGLINSWFIIGPAKWRTCLSTDYGHVLILKLAVFVGMLLLAASHRLVLTPLLRAELRMNTAQSRAVRTLRTSLTAEGVLGALVLVLVSALGTLPPP